MENIINKMGKTAAKTYCYAVEGAGKIAREIKLKSQMAENKSQISELYESIGKTVYEKHLLKENISYKLDFEEDCSMIDILANEIEELRLELLKLKDLKQCPKCHYEIEIEYKYCPNCGEVQEDSQNNNKSTAVLETTDENDTKLKKQNDIEEKQVSPKMKQQILLDDLRNDDE